MKKLFALLLTLAMLLGSAAMAEFDYTGLWTLTGAEVAGMPVDAAALGVEVSMLLNEDGSCVLTMSGEAENGTWVAVTDGVTVADAAGVAQTMKLVNNKLVAEQDGLKLIFGREAEEGFNYAGAWTLTGVEVNGVAQDLAAIGMSFDIVLNEDGSCMMSFQGEVRKGTWVVTETGITTTEENGASDTYTLVDGKLVVEVGIVKMIFARAGEQGTEKVNYVGEWALTSMKAPGMELNAELLSQYGMAISLSIREDGTWVMTSVTEAEAVEGTWEETEGGIVLDADGETLAFTYTDGALTVEEDGAMMSFTPAA